MGIFGFNKIKRNEVSEEYNNVLKFEEFISQMQNTNSYISRKEYVHECEKFDSTFFFFDTLRKSDMLEQYCAKNKISLKNVEKFLYGYANIGDVVDRANQNYVNKALADEEEYLDNILESYDPNVLLDYDQRQVILNDEDFTLVIAGAGAGKTTTVAAKVKYLVDKKGILPEEILVISFTNKAVNELKERINEDLSIPCLISTFHRAGLDILRKESDQKQTVVTEGFLYNSIQKTLKQRLQNTVLANNILLFFASYFDVPYEGKDVNAFFNQIAKSDFSTLKGNIEEYSEEIINRVSKKRETINSEIVRSQQEVIIANFLYLNGIDYEYEPIYKYHVLKANKFYTPDFIVKQNDIVMYIEHIALSENGEHSMWTADEIASYQNNMADKIALHKKHKTKLALTYSRYNDGSELTEKLLQLLIENGFVLNKRDPKEVLEKLIAIEENKYISRFVTLVKTFIKNFKTNGYDVEDLDRMRYQNSNVRIKIFLDIVEECLMDYKRELLANNAVDYEDMINNAARMLKHAKLCKHDLGYKYIIVDEYQDISRQRFDLTKELSKVTDAKIIAVGDDWQSIYAFSGSDLSLFTEFIDKMGYGKELKINRTYRNAQELIDIAGDFIQKNALQIKKTLISPKHIDAPVVIYSYDDTREAYNPRNKGNGVMFRMATEVQNALEHIVENSKNENQRILLIGRYNFDAKMLGDTKLFDYNDKTNAISCKKYPNINLEFMTAHRSKGLGFDSVIIINGKNDVFGFPSKIEDDAILTLVTKSDSSIEYAEERRLFYVALTRTKNRVYIIAPQHKPSEFILEILKNYRNIKLIGELIPNDANKLIAKKLCPICGYPLQRRKNKNFGLDLWVCSNEPELCGFMSNNPTIGTSIRKCPSCVDGYLIVKKAKNDAYFLGCTNYTKDGNGCECTAPLNDLDEKIKDDKAGYIAEEDYMLKEIEWEEPFPIDGKWHVINWRENASEQSQEKNVTTEDYEENNCIVESKSLGDDILSDAPLLNVQNNIADEDIVADVNEVIEAVYSCLEELNKIKKYGKTMLVDILIGSQRKRVFDRNLDALASYSTLRSYNRWFIEVVIDSLQEKGYLIVSKGMYPVIYVGKDVNADTCMNDPCLLTELVEYLNEIEQSEVDDIEEEDTEECVYNQALYEHLRLFRNSIARDKHVSPFIILSNNTLKELAEFMPITKEDFSKIKGIGKAKLELYSDLFIPQIKEFCVYNIYDAF